MVIEDNGAQLDVEAFEFENVHGSAILHITTKD